MCYNPDQYLFAHENTKTNFDLSIQSALLLVEFVIVIRIHLEVVESEFLLDSLLECHALFQGQGIGLGNDRYDVDDIGELLENDDVNWLKSSFGQYLVKNHTALTRWVKHDVRVS